MSNTKSKYLFIAVSFLLWFPHFIYVPILSPYMETNGISFSLIGIILGSYGLMQVLFRLPIGIGSDLVKQRKPFIILGMLASMLSCLIFIMTDSAGWIFVARSLAGIAAASWVAFTVLYSSYFSDKEVHRAMGSISFIIVLGQFLGMSFSGSIVEMWGWKAPFWIGVAASAIGFILSFFIFEPKEKTISNPMKLKDLTSVITQPSLLKIALLSILAHSIIFSTMFGFTPTYALQIGFQPSELTFIVFAFMIPHAIATLFMGRVIVPLLGDWRSLKLAFLLTAVFIFILPLSEAKWGFYVIQGFSGFALGLIFPLLLGMSIESITPEKRATAMGAYQAMYALGIFAGPFFSGIINSWMGIEYGFYFTGCLGLTATLLIVSWKRNEVSIKFLGPRKWREKKENG
ncbi:MFS transporter [Oceanobacillus zhaokaii]|uniref:MFS transporter n=1 Tax=Oceanobacillus zhaokaii TaxID=2052660 RepID=UPI001FA8CE81|nr:MFS transporter [Oceanobacillus zhaokaii]